MAPSAEFEAALAAELTGGDAAHDRGHAARVWILCQRIAAGEGVTPSRALMAAAYLHDLVTLPKDHPDRAGASRRSAEAARPVMARLGMTEAEVDMAAQAIESHSFSAGITPQTSEGRILQDADRIEALGAIGLARVFAVSGALGRALFDAEDPFAARRPPDDSRFAIDHFATKLLKLPGTMQTATGRAIAAERANILRRYLADLASELDCPPPGW